MKKFGSLLTDLVSGSGKPSELQGSRLIVSHTDYGKAAERRLAEAGATTKEVMAILGHTTLSEAERYIEEVDQVRPADGAVIKREQAAEHELSPNRFFEFGNERKKRRKINVEE